MPNSLRARLKKCVHKGILTNNDLERIAIMPNDVVTILDKIRAEIEASKWTNKDVRIERNALASGLDKALEIIDKYRK